MSFISRLLNPGRPAPGDAGAPPALHSPGQPQGPTPQQQHRRRPAGEPDSTLQIVIRGDSSVGKSCLLARLQGRPFVDEYTPTEKPHAATVRWSCEGRCASLTVWDAVDTGRPRRARSGLKLANEADNRAAQRQVSNGEDSPQTDPYGECQGAILMFDMTKAWTLAYVERELARAPKELPVLVLANHRDMGHHRCVTADQARMAIRESGRPTELTRYAESSMRNGYGLKYVHRFLGLPYLCTQRQRLLARLQANADDSETAVLELQLEEEESLAMSLDGVQSSKNEDDGNPITSSQEDSPPPEAPAKTPPCRLSAPPARLIPGAEQYLMELRRTQPQPPPAKPPPQRQNSSPPEPPSSESSPLPQPRTPQSPPQSAPPRPEPTGAPSTVIDKGDIDAGSEADENDQSNSIVVSTRVDDVDDVILAATATLGDGGAATSAEEEEEAPPPPPPVIAVDWGPLLARYEDPLPSPAQPPQPEPKPRKKKKKKQQEQQPRVHGAEEEEPRRPREKPSRKKKSVNSVAKQTQSQPQSLPTKPKVVMSKEEEELERFLNE